MGSERDRKPAREYALSLLEHGDRTARELRRRLREKGYSPEETEEAIAFLEEYHYVDDAGYVGRYIRSRGGRKSARQLRAELERKGVERELIEESLAEYPVDEEAQIIAFLRKKGYVPGQKLDPAEYRRLTGALYRRGYSFEAIQRATDRMCEED